MTMYKLVNLILFIHFILSNCLAFIFNPATPHTPCVIKSVNYGYCVPNRECCSRFITSWLDSAKGDCQDGHFCCTEQVKCQECPLGYEESNGTCSDINECDSFRLCLGHKCINTDGSYQCECYDSFEMIGDLKTCRHTKQQNISDLLYSESFKINSMSFTEKNAKTETIKMVYSGTVYPKSIDYSFVGNYMAWTDISTKLINIAPVNYEKPTLVIDRITINNLKQPYILSIDWIHDLIYWTDLQMRAINVVSIHSPNTFYTIINTTNQTPQDFKVNVADNCLVWTYVGQRPRIMRSLQDGSNQRVLFTSTKQPFYIAIDVYLKRYFIADISIGTLYSIDFEGKNDKYIFNWPNVLTKIITSPLIYSDDIFLLTDSNIYSYNKLGEKEIQFDFGINGKSPRSFNLTRLFDFKVLDPILQPSLENKCVNSQCSHICVPSDKSLVFRCLCPPNNILINDSICFDKQLENFLIDAINREKDLNFLINHSINKSVDRRNAINKSIMQQTGYNITHYIKDERSGAQLVLIMNLVIMSLVFIILLIIGIKSDLFRLKTTPKNTLHLNPLYRSSSGAYLEMETKA